MFRSRELLVIWESTSWSKQTISAETGQSGKGTAGVMYLSTYGAFGFAFWYGASLVNDEDVSAGSIFTVSIPENGNIVDFEDSPISDHT
ncbi:unnamed protein product [Nesidiocoris tenuis]|uniref:Uncharacterized protein n=1 Tax=Nesidiocoris tenuis TaxID=355587 RepID=A0A6H5G776_9HEMI|nr:unnamed protein product [Nesidiocoris tenuis]